MNKQNDPNDRYNRGNSSNSNNSNNRNDRDNYNNLSVIIDDRKAKYDEYAELLVRRDQLYKDAGSYMTAYTIEFGDLICENFTLKVECIKLKKTISYIRRRMNLGLKVDPDRMQAEIEQEMKLYNDQLSDMLKDNENAKKAENVGQYRVNRAKKIYRRLAKLIHPDINKLTMKDPAIKELWMKITEAYHHSDVDALDDLEVMVRLALEDKDTDDQSIDIPDIDERIERVERQINDIITTEPYTYREILESPEKTASYKEDLKAEHDEFADYIKTLVRAIEDMLREGGVKLIWKMN